MLRNAAYDVQILRSTTPGVPVVSVGNLTAGGTGKTPIVGWMVRYLVSQGIRPVIISRGYGRVSRGVRVVSDGTSLLLTAAEGGDEPVQLAEAFPSVPVVVGERRVDAAAVALERFRPDVLMLDDAFQHRAIGRHLNVLVVDAGADLTREPLLPAGRRREQLSGIRRASLIVLSRTGGSLGTVPWEHRLRRWYDGEIVYCTKQIASFRSGSGSMLNPGAYKGKRCLLLSGIGKPGQFEDDIRGLGLNISRHLRYADHYRYTRQDVETIVNAAARDRAEVLLTTEKDMVRLQAVEGAVPALQASVELGVAILDVRLSPAGRVEAYLQECVRKAA